MGTIESSESLALAEALRAQRTTTQADVDNAAVPAKAIYDLRQERHIPAAH